MTLRHNAPIRQTVRFRFTILQIVTPDGLRADLSQRHRSRARSWRLFSFWSRTGRSHRAGFYVLKGIIRVQRRCATYGWASATRRRWYVRRERAVAARSSFAIPRSSTREMPNRRKGEGPATSLIRHHGTQSTTLRKRTTVEKLVSCHECRRN